MRQWSELVRSSSKQLDMIIVLISNPTPNMSQSWDMKPKWKSNNRTKGRVKKKNYISWAIYLTNWNMSRPEKIRKHLDEISFCEWGSKTREEKQCYGNCFEECAFRHCVNTLVSAPTSLSITSCHSSPLASSKSSLLQCFISPCPPTCPYFPALLTKAYLPHSQRGKKKGWERER